MSSTAAQQSPTERRRRFDRQRKKTIRAPMRVQVVAVIAMLGVAAALVYFNADGLMGSLEDFSGRRLRNGLCERSEGNSRCPEEASHPALVIPLFFATLYLFVAVATVCDEFFVPALEEIGTRWDISDDIAGATLMAAGGSAPELATSLIGTFSGSDVGFGTIVGSAVFNVLFVIACCVIFTPKAIAPLQLTAWPLARDCIYYAITLMCVAILFGVNSSGEIEAWEAGLLFLLYFGYLLIMAYNEELHLRVTGRKITPDEEEEMVREEPQRRTSLCYPSRFRAGLFSLATQHASLFDSVGVGLVYRIKGDVRQVFEQLDEDKSGNIEIYELKKLLEMLNDKNAEPITDDTVAEVMKELDLDKNGVIDFAEFTVWYVKSEQRLQNEERRQFDELDYEKKGVIRMSQLHTLLDRLEAHYTLEQLEEAKKDFIKKGEDDGCITWEEFSHWYEKSDFWKERQHEAALAAEDAGGIWGELMDFPKDSHFGNLMYIVLAPITWPLAITCGIRDVRVPGNEGWCYFEFLTSIAWIGGYSFVMVDFVETIGATLGIPSVVMGLTFLAAGTSVPDLLSSVVVARAGKGDMAVSSSIGSNIFDVTVGLPVPWLLFNIVYNCPVVVQADNLFVSVMVLMGMVLSVVLSIMASGWKMNYFLGGIMMVLYVVFLTQDVVRVFVSSSTTC